MNSWLKSVFIAAGVLYLLFVVGVLIITHSLGRPSFYSVESVAGEILTFKDVDSLGIAKFYKFSPTDVNADVRYALKVRPEIAFEPNNTGTFEPGGLGILDSILSIRVRLVDPHDSHNVSEFRLEPMPEVSLFRLYADSSEAVVTENELSSNYLPVEDEYVDGTRFFVNQDISAYKNYWEFLNTGRGIDFGYCLFSVDTATANFIREHPDFRVAIEVTTSRNF